MSISARKQGKRIRQAAIIRSNIGPNGLPIKNFILARSQHMVRWDRITGEVSTIEYSVGKQIDKIWYDEWGKLNELV